MSDIDGTSVTHRQPFISVIVPVLNDRPRLEVCLGALQRQSYPPHAYEVLIVDNGSEQSITDLGSSHPNVVVLHERLPGSYGARNTALERAQGAIAAFTDSDCIPAPDWLERAAAQLQRLPARTILAGRIDRTTPDDATLSGVQLYDRIFFLRQDEYARRGWAVTANLFAPLAAFRSIGFFNRNLKSGGDFEWSRRARRGGFTIHYAQDVVVWHPTITTLPALAKKARRVAGGTVALQRLFRPGRWHELSGVARELYDVFPKWGRLRHECRETSWMRRVSVMATAALVQLVRAAERARLAAGGEPRRQ
jgi:glycosyltransferase involved in cell wall biosynthesis